MTISSEFPATPAAVNFRTVDLRGRNLTLAGLRAAVPRAQGQTAADAEEKVLDIIAAVRRRGFHALGQLALRFDGVAQDHPLVPQEALAAALQKLDPAVRSALEESISRARKFADGQRPRDVEVQLGDGALVAQNWVPVARVGLYVPGGLAVYPSSVIMNVVPALAAGVESIALASPPQKEFDGLPHPTILAAAALLGITEVYAIGGAQAIAALAFGAGDIPRVDKICGPGNAWVAEAKRLVASLPGGPAIDMPAGPSELMVIADDSADARIVAAD